jgi:hypothetical protein
MLPDGCTVTLLGDRGFGHRKLMKWCGRAGWHFILRLKADSSDSESISILDLIPTLFAPTAFPSPYTAASPGFPAPSPLAAE